MKIFEGKSVHGWLNWLEIEAGLLAKEEQDVRVHTRSGLTCLGSVTHASSGLGTLTVLTYDEHPAQRAFDAEDIIRVDVFTSRNRRNDRPPARSRRMEQIVIPMDLPIDDSCP